MKMIDELLRVENFIFENIGFRISNLEKDIECDEYFGYNFEISNLKIKFRKAKITPKKIGQFVTLWKRNNQGITEPFNKSDDFDFYIIVSECNDNFGFFCFSKQILVEKLILTDQKEGKRGFRIYPDWDFPENKLAIKTKTWQTNYFINFFNIQLMDIKFKLIFRK